MIQLVDKKKGLFNKIKGLGDNLFSKFFGFEEGIDITDDVAVLHRRNVVIKNIIFISNLFYSFLLLILSLTTKQTSDWTITIVSFPMTFLINKLLTTLISLDNKDKTKQLIAMYVASFYIFLSSVIIYARLYNGAFETVAYILIYYSLVVISLYQDKKLLRTAFLYLLVLVSLIHIIWTYSIPGNAQGQSALQFLRNFVSTDQFGDLILRTLVFSLFYLVVYVIVSIGQYMQEERKKELIKRRKVQNDFSSIVGSLFNAVFINDHFIVNQDVVHQVQKVSEKIAEFTGMNNAEINNVSTYSILHLRFEEVKDFNISSHVYDEATYETIKAKTNLGANIIKRIELSQTSESVVRSHVENTLDEDKMKNYGINQMDLTSQIILLSDIYLTLRSAKSYKRPYTHSNSLDLIETKIAPFFDQDLRERFKKFAGEIEEVYNNF